MIKNIISKNIYLFLFVFILFSCTKDPGPVDNLPTPDPSSNLYHGLFVINEGNFNWNNAEISFIRNNDNSIINNLYQSANAIILGDVAQSITISGMRAFVVMNNSHNITVVNASDVKNIQKITGFNSPRYLQIINSHKAYVTDLYQNAFYVLNLDQLSITKTMAVQGWTERMLLVNSSVYMTNMGNAKIMVVDTLSDQIMDSIPTVKEPNSIVQDYQHMIWVLCSGGVTGHENAALLKINPSTNLILQTFLFSASDYPTELCINSQGTDLYFLNNGICHVSVDAPALPALPLIPQNGRTFYRLGLHPLTGNVYVTDAMDYQQDGWVLEYTPQGNFIHQWKAGRIPGFMCFVP